MDHQPVSQTHPNAFDAELADEEAEAADIKALMAKGTRAMASSKAHQLDADLTKLEQAIFGEDEKEAAAAKAELYTLAQHEPEAQILLATLSAKGITFD